MLQKNPNNANSGVLNSQKGLGNGKHAVVRRYEFYTYTGKFDPATHEALGAGAGDCAAPLAGELGPLIGAQMAAANLEIPSITVVKVGEGTVTGAAGKINRRALCTAQEAKGTAVTLTANAPSDGEFSGWSGACTGANATCAVTVNSALTVTAKFTPVFTLSIGHPGDGSVTGAPNGALGTSINCGHSCSAKFPVGAAVTLNAAPTAGHVFVNWSGACSGTAKTCKLTITKDTKAQANFK